MFVARKTLSCALKEDVKSRQAPDTTFTPNRLTITKRVPHTIHLVRMTVCGFHQMSNDAEFPVEGTVPHVCPISDRSGLN